MEIRSSLDFSRAEDLTVDMVAKDDYTLLVFTSRDLGVTLKMALTPETLEQFFLDLDEFLLRAYPSHP